MSYDFSTQLDAEKLNSSIEILELELVRNPKNKSLRSED